MKRNLERLWKTKKPFKTRDIDDNGFFVISFEDEEDINHIYQDGPWMIADRYLIVQRWRPNFDPWEAEVQKKIAAWVQIPLLPLEFFNAACLRRIGSLIGRTLKIDMITYSTDRGRYARICVKLNLLQRLKSAINVFRRRRVLDYEGLHLICFSSGKYSHHGDACPEIITQQQELGSKAAVNTKQNEKSDNSVSEGDARNKGKEKIKPNEQHYEQEAPLKTEGHKRSRDEADAKASFGARIQTQSTGMGVWNLVQSPRHRIWENPDRYGIARRDYERQSGAKKLKQLRVQNYSKKETHYEVSGMVSSEGN